MTGMKFDASTNELLHNNVAVSHNHPLQVLLDFIQFVMLLGKSCVLVAHNNKCFDSIVLYNQLKYYKIWNHFCKYVVGFCDTLNCLFLKLCILVLIVISKNILLRKC